LLLDGLMKRKRLKIDGERAYYHLLSRTVNGEKLFGTGEKEVLRKMIRQVAAFSGIHVITYAIMDNHFHLLVEVPEEREVSDREILERYKILYPRPTVWNPMGSDVLEQHLKTDSHEGKILRKNLLRRMHDISWMMKTLKQRFAFWFNRSRKRFGPLWSGPFKSLLVEAETGALSTVAAYIDLNAVRAGKVDDPKDYRYCGYAEALGSKDSAREGLLRIEKNLALYRQRLFGTGARPHEGKAFIDPAKAREVIEREKGELPLHILLRQRLRFLSEGSVFGSPSFVSKALSATLRDSGKRPPAPRAILAGAFNGKAVAKGDPKEE